MQRNRIIFVALAAVLLAVVAGILRQNRLIRSVLLRAIGATS
jgi:hypothetical protein